MNWSEINILMAPFRGPHTKACGIVLDYLWFWLGICGILRQLSHHVCFRFVFYSFFSDGLYS